MLSLALILASHIPSEHFLRCDDFEWLKEGVEESELFTPRERSDMILHWINHTDPKCFDN